MIRTMINGFCMALADSVPGVSGGTIALRRQTHQKMIPIRRKRKKKV